MKVSLDENSAGEQQIKVLSHRTRKRVLNRNNRNGNLAGFKLVKDFSRTRTRNNCAAGQHAACGFMTKGPGLSLNGNFHLSTLAGQNRRKQILVEHESVHTIRRVTRYGPQHV